MEELFWKYILEKGANHENKITVTVSVTYGILPFIWL